MNERGILIVVSGFSGAGKGTLMKRLLEKYEERYALSVSATTRQPREGECDGIEYFFKTKEEFEKMIAKEELIEYARYVENYYGTPRAYVEQMLEAGKDVILEIENSGSAESKKSISGYAFAICRAAKCRGIKAPACRSRNGVDGSDRVQIKTRSGRIRRYGAV